MVHPTDLLRTDSSGDGSFVAPVVDYRNNVDCGCKILPCLTYRLNLEKYAKPKVFVGVLSFTQFLNGIISKYFRGTSQIWSRHYDIPQETIEWVIYTNEVLVGIFALVVAYWGNRVHRPNWLGALTIYSAVASITLIVPEIYQPYDKHETDIDNINGGSLCEIPTHSEITKIATDINNQGVAFGILIICQLIYALCTISFITHGITYIDDNISPKNSLAFIALVFGAQKMGKQAGLYSSWMPYIVKSQYIFISSVWLTVSILILVMGTLIAMFPKVLPNTLLKKSVNSLLNIAAGNLMVEDVNTVDGFFTSVWRILKNKILLLNIVSFMLIQAAIINFSIQEKNFNQSKYHVPKYNDASGYSDPTLIQFSTNLLKQPLLALSYMTSGLIIAKMRPKAKHLVIWNIAVISLVTFSFAGIRFIGCTNKLKNEPGDRLIIPYCSWNCGCSLDGPFQPICLNRDTYFSACFAGCRSFDTSLKIYQNCTCGPEGRTTASEGSCDIDNCSTLWALAQTNNVISASLLGTIYITTLTITLRCVQGKDKAIALGLQLTLVSLFSYLPVRAIYDIISDNYCQIWGKSSCQFYSESFAMFLSSSTVFLKALAIVTMTILLFFIDELELYTNHNSKRGSDVNISARNTLNMANNDHNNIEADDNGALLKDPEETEALVHNSYNNILRNKQMSDSRLERLSQRSSKEDRINAYLSEGDLIPPLKTNLRLGKSTSRNSNSNVSGLSTDSSLSAIANTVGDDHDSEVGTLQRPQRVKMLEKQLQGEEYNKYSSAHLNHKPRENVIETEF